MKKSNIIVGLVVAVLLVGGAGWWAFSSPAEGKDGAIVPVQVGEGTTNTGSEAGEPAEGFTGDTSGGFVASKNGTKYFPTSCGSAKTIKEENKVFFQSTSEAESAGYTPAKNC